MRVCKHGCDGKLQRKQNCFHSDFVKVTPKGQPRSTGNYHVSDWIMLPSGGGAKIVQGKISVHKFMGRKIQRKSIHANSCYIKKQNKTTIALKREKKRTEEIKKNKLCPEQISATYPIVSHPGFFRRTTARAQRPRSRIRRGTLGHQVLINQLKLSLSANKQRFYLYARAVEFVQKCHEIQ